MLDLSVVLDPISLRMLRASALTDRLSVAARILMIWGRFDETVSAEIYG
jgi:hypothetical protein